MLDLVHVRSFVALAAELNFSRAARRLNMTQPPLSRQIRLLEEHLGSKLFDRTSQSVALTAAGRKFLPEAQALLRQVEDMEALVRENAQEPEGKVRLGFYGAACFRLLPSLMVEISRVYPRIEMELRELNATQQIDAFSFGELDIGLARPTVLASGLRAQIALREALLVALPKDHPLTTRTTLRPEDLHQQPFIAYGTGGPYLHSLQRSIFAQHGITPRITQSLAHAETILSLVGAGLGIAIVSSHARHAARENLVFRPMTGFKIDEAITHKITRADMRKPAVKLISQLICEVGRRLEMDERLPKVR